MKACVLVKPNELICEDIPTPVIEKDEVLIKVMACGICGSDLRYLKGDNPWSLHTLGVNLKSPKNMVLGHEFAGVVCEVGDSKNGHLLGKRVAVEPYNTCGVCEKCRTGRYNLCENTVHIGHGAGWGEQEYYPGGMAQYCRCWASHVYELPEDISFQKATILDPLAVAVHAVNVSEFKPGMSALVLGTGPVGLCLGAVLKSYGCRLLLSADIVDNSLAFAASFGTDISIDSTKQDLAEAVMASTGGRGVDVVLDTAGTEGTLQQGLKCLADSGHYVSLVAENHANEFRLSDLSGEKSIKISANNLYGEFLEAIRIMDSGLFDFDKMITHTFAIDDVLEAFDIMKNKDRQPTQKVVILPWE